MMDYERHAEAIQVIAAQQRHRARAEVIAVAHEFGIPVVIETTVPAGAPWYAPNYDPSKDQVQHYDQPIR
jgi:hypothetical protein